MPNKLETSYKEVLQLMKEMCFQKGHNLDITYIHSDCERAILNATKNVFPNTENRLCIFHIFDALGRGADVRGVRKLIHKNLDLKSFYTRVRAVFFFPP